MTMKWAIATVEIVLIGPGLITTRWFFGEYTQDLIGAYRLADNST